MSAQPPVETVVKKVVPKPKAKAALNPQDPNNSLHFIKLSNDEANNPIVNGEGAIEATLTEADKFTYLGQPR